MREGVGEGGRERGREEEEGGREGRREGVRKKGREGGREGGRKGGREGMMEEWAERGGGRIVKEVRRQADKVQGALLLHHHYITTVKTKWHHSLQDRVTVLTNRFLFCAGSLNGLHTVIMYRG